jgi:hypothetical protein
MCQNNREVLDWMMTAPTMRFVPVKTADRIDYEIRRDAIQPVPLKAR